MLDTDGYFYSTIADLQESTGLTRYQQDRAIKSLAEINLIECCKKGIPARRYFRVNNDIELLRQLLEKGERIMLSLNPSTVQNNKQVCGKVANLFAENSQTCMRETYKHTYNPNNKSKDINPNLSILPDGIDITDNSSEERDRYSEIIKENIEYECQTEKERIDELVGIMLDVICSKRETIRVNGEEIPQEIVRSRFLKLDSGHIEYVTDAMKKSAPDVRNIRAYLITVLYNAPTTMDSYYSAWVNHDMLDTYRK